MIWFHPNKIDMVDQGACTLHVKGLRELQPIMSWARSHAGDHSQVVPALHSSYFPRQERETDWLRGSW